MRIDYINTDEVNLAVASRLAGRHGAVVRGLWPGGPPPDGARDAVLYNLDVVPRGRRGECVAEILRGRWTCPTAAHGYDLPDDQADALRRRGVVVARRLDAALIEALCRNAPRPPRVPRRTTSRRKRVGSIARARAPRFLGRGPSRAAGAPRVTSRPGRAPRPSSGGRDGRDATTGVEPR